MIGDARWRSKLFYFPKMTDFQRFTQTETKKSIMLDCAIGSKRIKNLPYPEAPGRL